MSLTQIKDRAACLKLGEQRELIAFLVALQTNRDEEFRRVMAEKIDDTDPSHWISLEDLRKRYA